MRDVARTGDALQRDERRQRNHLAPVAGDPVAGDVHTPDGGVVLTERPGGRAFVAVHTGPYDGLATTYAEVEGYADEYGLGQREDCWEEYLTEPTGDPSTWRTRVVVPLR